MTNATSGSWQQQGNDLIGSYSSTSSDSSTITIQESAANTGGSSSYTESSIVGASAQETGNSLSGDYSRTSSDDVTVTLVDSGSDDTGSYTVEQSHDLSTSRDESGNNLSGSYSATGATGDTYSLSETVAGTAGFSLTETGGDDTTLTESGNHVLATYRQDVVGSDTASFIETGSNTGGSYSETLLVNETASWTQTGNTAQQTFSKTETGTGDYIRTDTVPGATLGRRTNSTRPRGLSGRRWGRWWYRRELQQSVPWPSRAAPAAAKAVKRRLAKLKEVEENLKKADPKACLVDKNGNKLNIRCFLPETLVSTETGLQPITRIKTGDRVWGHDFATRSWRLCEVAGVHENSYSGMLVTVKVGESAVAATAYHPFWVVEGDGLETRPAIVSEEVKEGLSGEQPGRWVYSHDLRAGDVVLLKGGERHAIREVTQRQGQSLVYNLTVADLHTFAVGAASVLVHNADPLDCEKALAEAAGNAQANELKAAQGEIASQIEEIARRRALGTSSAGYNAAEEAAAPRT